MAQTGTSPTNPSPLPPRLSFSWAVATFGGIGFLRPGPGTWASAATVIFWWSAMRFVSPPRQWLCTLFAAGIVTALGIPFCSIVARESGVADPSFAVIDEVAGQLISLIAVPLRWQYVLASLILFRGFDILKPPPLRQLEKLPEGAGIMLDDVGAGIFAYLVMQALLYFKLFG